MIVILVSHSLKNMFGIKLGSNFRVNLIMAAVNNGRIFEYKDQLNLSSTNNLSAYCLSFTILSYSVSELAFHESSLTKTHSSISNTGAECKTEKNEVLKF